MVKEEKIYSVIELDEVSSAILNALDAQIAVLNRQGEVVAFNKKWKVFSDELQESWSHPGLEESILQSLQAPLAEGNDFALRLLLGVKEVLSQEKGSFETKLRHTVNGANKWFKVTINSLGYEQGAVLVFQDISNEIQSRKFLRETRQKFEKHFHHSLYGILVADENNVIIDANEVACNLLETTSPALIFSDIENYLNFGVSITELQKKVNRDGSFFGELDIKTANGNKLPIELSVTLFRNEDGSLVTSWAFKDITDKKHAEEALKMSEQQYKLQFNNTLEGTIIGRPNGQIITVNPAACEMLGYKAEELQGKYRDIIFDAEYPPNKKALTERRKNGTFIGEVEFTHKSGNKIPVEISSVIFKGEDGTEKTIVHIKDISSRRAIQKQLVMEKEFTEHAISSLPTAFFVFSVKGEMIRWNTILEKELGYTHDEIANLNVMDLVHPDDRIKLKDILEGELVGNKVSVEARCITKDGESLHYLIRGTSFKQNGEYYIVGGGLNRNDFKELENEKNRNAQLLSQLFYNSPIGITLVDTEGKVESVNKSFEQIFGYTQQEIEGKDLNQTIVPEHEGQQAKVFSHLSYTGDSFQSEAMRLTKEGKEIPVLIGGVPVEVDGKVVAIYGMYVDITERKELENQVLELLNAEKKARLHMQDMFEEAPSAIALIEGEDHRYTFANNTYKNLIKKEDVTGKTASQLLPEFKEQGFIDLFDTCYKEGKVLNFIEAPIEIHDQETGEIETVFVNYVLKPLFNETGEVYGIFMEAIDVTEQVKARNIIEQSLVEKNTLLGEVHHRVKNNLAIVSGLLELELMATENKEISKHLSSTQSRITSIAKIHELLYKNESLSHVNFKNYIESVLVEGNKTPLELIDVFELKDVTLNVNQAIPTGMLLNEIISCLEDVVVQEYGNKSGGLTLKLKHTKECVTVEFHEKDKALLKYFNNCDNATADLRMELIDVLLRQIRGEMEINVDGDHSYLSISFAKRETKGPHNALKKLTK